MSRFRHQQRRGAQEKRRKSAALNLVSLMDIFTILVFFLLVNSSAVETLPSAKALELPEAFEQRPPEETVSVMITRDQLLVQGERVAGLDEIIDGDELTIAVLRDALERQPKTIRPQPGEEAVGRVTVMADKSVPYRVIKRIMATCTEAQFPLIALAVMQKTEAEGSS